MNKNRGFDKAQARGPLINPNKWLSCGVQSLHHSMLLLGMSSDLSKLPKESPLVKRKRDLLKGDVFQLGHYFSELQKLARHAGAKSEDLTVQTLPALKKNLNWALRKGYPVILGNDPLRGYCPLGEGHWLVVAGFDDDGDYVWIDSADESSVAGIWDWAGVVDFVKMGGPPYEALAVLPPNPEQISRSMVPHIGGIYELLGSDEVLAGKWGVYLDDLDKVFTYEKTKGPDMDAGTFVEGNEEAIVHPVLWMDDDLEEDVVREAYANYHTVANFHSLSLPACFEAHAVAQMAIILKSSVT